MTPNLREIEIIDNDESEGTIECTISYQNGESKVMTLLSKKVEELVHRKKPALVVAE